MERPSISNRAAVIMSAAALIMSVGFAGGPALARAMVSNSHKVDGLHAVKATATATQRKGKLVATDATGSFKSNVIPNDAKFPPVVPVGVRLSGMFNFDMQSAGMGGDYGSVIDYQTMLPQPVKAVFSPTGVSVLHCPGSVLNPLADPGYICLYRNGGAGMDWATFISFNLGNRGLGYRFDGNAPGANSDVFVNGTWALTTAATTPMKRNPAAGSTK